MVKNVKEPFYPRVIHKMDGIVMTLVLPIILGALLSFSTTTATIVDLVKRENRDIVDSKLVIVSVNWIFTACYIDAVQICYP